MAKRASVIRYDAAENVLFLELAGVKLDTVDDITDFFVTIAKDCRAATSGKSTYIVIDYTGFSVNLRENAFYAGAMKRCVTELAALAVVRYGGDSLQRAAARSRGMLIHTPANLYATRDEALQVVKGLRAGTVTQGS